MDNKNEKTFADLFSSSTVENNSEEITNNMKSEVNNEIKEESTSLTFDSLFDQASKSEDVIQKSVEKVVGLNSLMESDGNNNTLSMNDVLEKNDNNENENNFSFSGMNSLFDSSFGEIKEEISRDKDIVTNDVDNVISDLDNKAEVFEKKNASVNEDNLEKDNIVSNIDENLENPFLKNDSLDLEKNVESVNNDSNSLVSPFFNDGDKLQETTVNILNEDKGVEQNVNPLFGADGVNELSSVEDNINSSVSQLEISNDIFSKEKSQEEDTSLIEHKSSNTEPSESLLDSSKVILEEEKENFWDEPKFDKKEVENAEKSVSPFFEEKKVVEENPLFLDRINLIENEEVTKKISKIDTSNTKHFDVSVVKKKEPLLKFIVGVASYALFILLLLIGVTLLVYVLDIKIRAAKGDYSAPKFNAYVVLTGSMLPEIQVFDVVVTKKVDAAKLEEGDVITFASADTRFLNTIITHRIIKKNYDSKTKSYNFQTKGDNNNVADSALVPQNKIYGKVILKIPKLGYLQEFLASRGGWIIVILIPCLTVISYDVVKLLKGLKRNKYKNIKIQK